MSALPEFLVFALVGAAAQLVDGALGMAYGVTSAGLLLGLGMPPVMASASVHYAETFTCGASGLSHLAAGNVRRRLFLALAIPGVVGALLGVWLAVQLPTSWMRIALTPYLLGMGLFLLLRGAKRPGERTEPPRGTSLLGAVAGSNLAKHDRGTGATLGAVAGAATGSYVGCKMQRDRQAQEAYGYGPGYEAAQPATYVAHGLRLSGQISPAAYVRDGGTFVAASTVNLRGAPTTSARRVGQLRAGERFQAMARVRDSDWILVGQGGVGPRRDR